MIYCYTCSNPVFEANFIASFLSTEDGKVHHTFICRICAFELCNASFSTCLTFRTLNKKILK